MAFHIMYQGFLDLLGLSSHLGLMLSHKNTPRKIDTVSLPFEGVEDFKA